MPGAAGRVLVADDDAATRRFLERGLRLNGFGMALAGDGRAAWDALHTFRPDIVVLDVCMPHLSGSEICRALREDGDAVPVLMLSALDEAADRIAGLEAGCDDYLVKPFAPGIVLTRDQLLVSVWGYDVRVRTDAVDTFVSYLRRKPEAGGHPRVVHTVRGVGFVLRTERRAGASGAAP